MKSVEKQNHPRFTNDELGIIKDVFAENDELIRVCYRVFFQLPLTAIEKEIVKRTFQDVDLRSIFDKLFCPRLENEQTFLGIDDWYDLQFTEKPLNEAMLFIKARLMAIEYVTQQVGVLFGETEGTCKFSSLLDMKANDGMRFSKLVARKEIINKVRGLFGTLQVWAGTKKENKAEMMKRLFDNSNK